ncbi:MAG: hypothetical protein KDC34_15970 [Saprospiraceae bacterium]|nr:hypothetical protein [Saprospiraceae bacterium]
MTRSSLDFSASDFRLLLDQAVALVLDQFKDLDNHKAYHFFPQKELASWFDQPVPVKGMDVAKLLEEVKQQVLDTATGNLGPHMYAYVMAGGTQVSILAELLAATVNQNAGKWHLAPAMNEIEKRVVQWGSAMIGYGKEVAGVLVSGGSAANLAGLTIARNIFFEKQGVRTKGLFGMPPFIVYASSEVHGCVDKSLEQLGIGTNNLRKIQTKSDFTMDLGALEKQINLDRASGFLPFCIIGNAGTVNTGAIDDLEALALLAQKQELWFHVDGAYGGLAASLDTLKAKYKGLELADSVAVDFHKWLYQPFEAGCIMVKDWDTLRRAYFKKADYLDTAFERDKGRLDFNEHHFQLSRNAKGLKIWMSFKAYGLSAFQEMIQKDIDLARYLADQVEESPDFELHARSDLAICCFRYRGTLREREDIEQLNKDLIAALEEDGRVFITGTKLHGEFVLRACLINHRKQKHTVDYLLEVIRDVAKTSCTTS